MVAIKSTAALLAALAPFALAQTFSKCKDDLPSCPVNTAQKDAKLNAEFGSGGTPPDGFKQSQCKGKQQYDSNGVALVIEESGDCPAVESEAYFFFGLVEVKMKAAPGAGIVSSIVMESDALDEVDWEFIGGEDYRVQSNYFGKGDTSSFDRMVYVPIPNTQTESHTYGVNWTSAALTWLVDGAPVRTLLYEDAKGGSRFPQTPMKLKVGVWAGGDADQNAEGTVEWAMGGKSGSTNYADGPFSMYVESINIVNYSPADSYTYGDNTGSYQSIKVEGGKAGGILSPEEAAAVASQAPKNASITTGSAIPTGILATATANGTASGSFVTSTIDGQTVISAATSSSTANAQSSNSASTFGIAGGVLGSAVLGLLMTVFA